MNYSPKTMGRNKLVLKAVFPIILIALVAGMTFPQQAKAQSVVKLEPPQNVHRDEGQVLSFGCGIRDVALGDITSVTVYLADNSSTVYETRALSYSHTDADGDHIYNNDYQIPYDWCETYAGGSAQGNLKWYIECVYTGGTITGPGSGNHVVHVHEASPTYEINCVIDPAAGGTVTSTNPVTGLSPGDPVSFDYTINPGYYITGVTFTCGGSESHTDTQVTITGTTNGGTVTVHVAQEEYTVNCVFDPSGGGTVTSTNPVTGLNYGDNVSFNYTVNPGWSITNVTTTSGGTVTYNSTSCTVTGITNSGTVTVHVTQADYTVNCVFDPSGGGTVTSTNPLTGLNYGDNASFTYTLNTGWSISDVTTTSGGTVTYSDTGCTVTGTTNGGTVTVHCTQLTYTVDAVVVPSAGATVTSDNPVTGLVYGDDPTFTLNITSGWYIVSVSSTTGTASYVGNVVTVTDITGNGTCTINMARYMGTLNVNIDPEDIGATYTISGPGDFNGGSDYTSGTDYSSTVPSGNYTVTFSSVTNYSLAVTTSASAGTPFSAGNPSSGTINADETHTVNGVYSPIPGSLTVYIEPAAELGGQGGWRFVGGTSWKVSGQTETNLNPGIYNLEFQDVPDWNKPNPRSAEVFSGEETVVTVFYWKEEGRGHLQVFITDNQWEFVLDEGARWRPVGLGPQNVWYKSGDIIYDVPVGDYGLVFKLVPGYVLPDLTGCTVLPDIVNKYTGEYYRQTLIHTADYNGDGLDDLGNFNHNNGRWLVSSITKVKKKKKSKPAVQKILNKKFGGKYDIPTPGDYDGDGTTDLSYYRESNGTWAVKNQFTLEDFGEFRDIPVPGDYNGDGKTDPALFRPSTGEWFLYLPFQKTKKKIEMRIIEVQFGQPGDVPVPGNWDGDPNNQTDLAIYNVVSGKWTVAVYNEKKDKWVQKKKLRKPKKQLLLNYGDIGDVPLQADYDGDGRIDHALYIRSNSMWKVLDQYEIEFGEHGEYPVPNDWAGLGRVIPAVFNVRTGQWKAIDNLLKAKHGRKSGLPLMSGR